jgi:hypothetical protein
MLHGATLINIKYRYEQAIDNIANETISTVKLYYRGTAQERVRWMMKPSMTVRE